MARTVKYLGIGKESVFGTEVAATEYIDVDDWSGKTNKKWNPRGGVGASYQYAHDMVAEDGGMNFNFPVGPANGIGHLLRMFRGAATSAAQGGTAAYKHTFLGDDSRASYTLLGGSGDLAEEPWPGQVGKTLKLSSAPGGVLSCAAQTYGLGKGADNTIGSPSFSTVAAWRHRNLALTVDTVAKSAYVGAVSLEIDDAIKEGEHTAGSKALQNQPKHTKTKVAGSIELSRYDAALRTAYHAESEVALVLSWVGAECATGYYYTLTVTLPKVILGDYEHPVKLRDNETHTVPFEAHYDSTTTSEMKIELTNLATAYA